MEAHIPELSVIIVTYNHSAEIQPCLTAVVQNTKLRPLQIIVVDNASDDDTVDIVRQITRDYVEEEITVVLSRNSRNLGYTKAVNQGLQKATGKFLLLLNPDVVVFPNTIDKLISFLQNHPDCSVAAPQLLFPNFQIQPSCRRFPRRRDVLYEILGLNRIFPRSSQFNSWKMADFDHCHTRKVDQPQGACLLTTRAAFAQVGYLDERFRMFFSDVDWCKRFIEAGGKVVFYPEAKAIHRKGTSVYRYRRRMVWISHWDFIRYFWKHYPKVRSFLPNILVSGLLLKTGIIRWIFARASRKTQ